jgi:hypothetical protein
MVVNRFRSIRRCASRCIRRSTLIVAVDVILPSSSIGDNDDGNEADVEIVVEDAIDNNVEEDTIGEDSFVEGDGPCNLFNCRGSSNKHVRAPAARPHFISSIPSPTINIRDGETLPIC